MRIKQFALIPLACCLALTFSGCASHKKLPNNVGVIDPNHVSGVRGEETYTEGQGFGNEGGAYAESSKCRPGRRVPGAEQHYFFDFDSSEVRQEAFPSIQMQANYLLKHPGKKIRLEGNTDDVGSREYNIALGERRARSVLEILKQNGVAASQVTVVSFGAEKPAVGGEDEKSRQCNRRVDLIYTSD
jgi:peptidoglycan-associated lipoprotein